MFLSRILLNKAYNFTISHSSIFSAFLTIFHSLSNRRYSASFFFLELFFRIFLVYHTYNCFIFVITFLSVIPCWIYQFSSNHWCSATPGVVSAWTGDRLETPRAFWAVISSRARERESHAPVQKETGNLTCTVKISLKFTTVLILKNGRLSHREKKK